MRELPRLAAPLPRDPYARKRTDRRVSPLAVTLLALLVLLVPSTSFAVDANGLAAQSNETEISTETANGWRNLVGGGKGYARNGRLVTGWLDLNGCKYYFDNKGRMLTGWADVVVNGKTMHYYFNPTSGNLARNTWMEINGRKYYFRPSGNMATGFADVDSDAYKRYFDQQGRMLTGWQTIGTGTYYFRESGAMQTGTATIGGRQYTFSDNGTLVK